MSKIITTLLYTEGTEKVNLDVERDLAVPDPENKEENKEKVEDHADSTRDDRN